MAENLRQSADNVLRKVFDETSQALRISGTISVPAPVGAATEATLNALNTKITSVSGRVQVELPPGGSGLTDAELRASPLPTLQQSIHHTTGLIDTSATPIPSGSYLTLIASTSATYYKFQFVEDIGEFMAFAVGAPGSEIVKAILPLGGGEINLQVTAGSRISITSLKGSSITLGKFAMNSITLI